MYLRTCSAAGAAAAVVLALASPGLREPARAEEGKPRPVVEIRGAGSFCRLAFSPDGKLLASGSSKKTVEVWDAATGKLRATLRGHADWVRGLAFSPDGRTLVSGDDGGALRLWEVATGQERAVLRGHSGRVQSVAFSGDGKTLASGTDDCKDGGAYSRGEVMLWDVAPGRRTATLYEGNDGILAVALSPDGKTVAAAGADVRLWRVNDARPLAVLKQRAVSVLAFSPDGRMLAAGGILKDVRVWEVATGRERAAWTSEVILSHTLTLAFSPDGRALACGLGCQRHDGNRNRHDWPEVRLWDVAGARAPAAWSARGDDGREVCSAVFSPDRKRLAAAAADGTIKVWDVPAAAAPR